MKLKEIRCNFDKVITQKDMANTLNISERQYRRLEQEESLPNVKVAIRIAKMFNTSVERIWDE